MLLSPAAQESLRALIVSWCQSNVSVSSLSEAEAVAEEARAFCGQVVLAEALSATTGRATYQGAQVSCGCGGQARFVSYRRRWIKTLCGEVKVERAYYHCSVCHTGVAPWDREQGLNSLVFTPRAKALVAQACGCMPYAEAVALLHRAGALCLSESSAEQIVAEVGARLRAKEAEQVQQARQDTLEPARCVQGQRLYISMDAAKGHIDGEWHDVKVGVLYTARPNEEGQDTLAEREYVARQENSEAFGWRLYAKARAWGEAEYAQKVFLGDGAEYNWQVAALHFPDALPILDFWHAADHIGQSGRLLYGEGSEPGRRWIQQRIHSLKEHGPGPLLRSLARRKPASLQAKEALRLARGYFERNRHRMDYPAYRQQGMMIGSGPVEAACKVVVGQRMKQAGMRWSGPGADCMLAVRTTVLNKEFDHLLAMARAA